MSLDEILNIMDVASEIRKQQSLVEREFEIDQTRAQLREKLHQTAAVTGESITNEQIEAAIDWYFDHLHTFKPPQWGLGLLLAHIYIRRTQIGIALGALLVLAIIYWTLYR